MKAGGGGGGGGWMGVTQLQHVHNIVTHLVTVSKLELSMAFEKSRDKNHDHIHTSDFHEPVPARMKSCLLH
jgi:hypothetical protein